MRKEWDAPEAPDYDFHCEDCDSTPCSCRSDERVPCPELVHTRYIAHDLNHNPVCLKVGMLFYDREMLEEVLENQRECIECGGPTPHDQQIIPVLVTPLLTPTERERLLEGNEG